MGHGRFAFCLLLNLALLIKSDYRDTWRNAAFAWKTDGSQAPGDTTRLLRT